MPLALECLLHQERGFLAAGTMSVQREVIFNNGVASPRVYTVLAPGFGTVQRLDQSFAACSVTHFRHAAGMLGGEIFRIKDWAPFHMPEIRKCIFEVKQISLSFASIQPIQSLVNM